VITDVNGDPVRDARVFITGPRRLETQSNSSGAYVLDGVPEGDILVQASVTQDNIRFYGQNMARIFGNERNKSVNVAVARENQLARITGTVTERAGLRVSGARVFAIGNALTSSMAITDINGNFTIGGLMAGINYTVQASARTYNSDTEGVTLAINETRNINFVLKDPTSPTLPAPQNLEAVAWTSPHEPTRSTDAAAYEQIKRLYDPRRAQARQTSRLSAGGNPIEIDLYWDGVASQALLGYGIYRGIGAQGPVTAIDFLRDPLAEFFADNDPNLIELTTYSYQITALNTSYPDTPNSESERSNRVSVRPIGDMVALPILRTPITFRWQPAPGAETYVVFLFNRYPRLGVDSIWNNSGSPTASNELVYTGPNLQVGQTYYWVVLGIADGADSRTISRIQSFVR
jgi:hypothetical protein